MQKAIATAALPEAWREYFLPRLKGSAVNSLLLALIFACAERLSLTIPSEMILDALHRIANHGQSLARAEAREVMAEVLAGNCTDAQIAALLMALRMKGETVEEIVGFAEAIRGSGDAFAYLRLRGALDPERHVAATR